MSTVSEALSALGRVKSGLFAASAARGMDTAGCTFETLHQLWGDALGGAYQKKTALPAAEDVTYGPDTGYAGLAALTVPPAPQLKPENIRAGVTLFGVEGTMIPAPSHTVPEDFRSADPANPAPGSLEDALAQYAAQTGQPWEEGVLLLADGEGGLTYGFLEQGEAVCRYGAQALPALPAWWDRETYPYAVIVRSLVEFRLVLSKNKPCTTSGGNSNVKVEGAYLLSVPRRSGDCARWTEPEAGEDFYETTSLLWANTDIPDALGAVAIAGSEPEPLGFFRGFAITDYDAATTAFRARKWRRLKWREGTWLYEDFTEEESDGADRVCHILCCPREALQLFRAGQLWPEVTEKNKWSYNGVTLPVMPVWDKAAYPYSIVFGADRGAAYYYDTVVSNRPFRYLYSDDAASYQLISEDICKYQQYRTSADNRETLYRAAGSGTQVYITPGNEDLVWTDHHIFNEYGGIWFAATDPVPMV